MSICVSVCLDESKNGIAFDMMHELKFSGLVKGKSHVVGLVTWPQGLSPPVAMGS